MMAIEGAVVTIDAMGAQRSIATKIIDKKADYIIALKGNQGTLHADVNLFCAERQANGLSYPDRGSSGESRLETDLI
jgi:predicted transposase YbfD/YdcC